MPVPQPPAQRRMPTPHAVLLIASFGAFLAFLDSTIVNVAFPSIATSFPHSSLSTLSWVLNAYNIVFAGFLVAAGRLADLLGRRRLFVGGIVLFTVASAACGAATSAGALIAFRVVQGVGAAVLVPASLALVTQAFPPERLARGIALWGAAAALASGLGPPIGGALVSGSTWRVAFLVNVPFGAAAVYAARRGLVESRAPGRRRLPDLRGAGLLAAGLGALTLAIVKGSDWGWADARTAAVTVAALLALAGFAVSNARHAVPVLDAELLRQRRFAAANVLTVVAGAGFYAYTLDHILWLRYVWGYSLFRAGLAVAPGALVAAVAAAVLGRLAERRGHRPVVVAGAVAWAVALGYFYAHRVGLQPDFLGAWLPAQVVSGLGVGAVLPVLGSSALLGIPNGRYATASAAVSSARQLGAVLGVAVLVAIVGTHRGLDGLSALRHGWQFSAVCFLVVACGSILLGRDPAPATEVDPSPPLTLPSPRRAPAPDRPAGGRAGRAGHEVSLLTALAPKVRAELQAAMRPVTLPGGEALFHAGDKGDGLYLVVSGLLEVVRGGQVVSELGRGCVVGEMALLTGAPRSATVRARRDTRLLHLSARRFALLAQEQPKIPLAVARALAVRLQEVQPPELPRRQASVVAVVALDRAAPVADVSAHLVALLDSWVHGIDPGRVDADGLERAERAYNLVVLTAGAEDGPWREFCLRVADRVVAVADGGTDPARVRRLPAVRGADLVVCAAHLDTARTVRWVDLLAPASLHVAGSSPTRASLRPLAARLAGRSLGLVLAGGGARAFAHLGVIDELEAAGVVVDRIAGTSAGAIIGAGLALGMTAAELDATVHEEFVRRNPLNDYTLPRHGLARGEKTRAGLRRRFGDVLIEEMPREFRCVSVDLLRRAPHVHARGSLVDAVTASLRLPGLFAPYRLGDALHVDGGVLSNLPVEALTDRPEGPVIAVNISMGGSSGARTGQLRTPGLMDTMMRTMLMGSGDATERALALADVVISPRAEGVGLLEWHQIDVMREAGRRAAREAMPQVLALASGGPDAEQASLEEAGA